MWWGIAKQLLSKHNLDTYNLISLVSLPLSLLPPCWLLILIDTWSSHQIPSWLYFYLCRSLQHIYLHFFPKCQSFLSLGCLADFFFEIYLLIPVQIVPQCTLKGVASGSSELQLKWEAGRTPRTRPKEERGRMPLFTWRNFGRCLSAYFKHLQASSSQFNTKVIVIVLCRFMISSSASMNGPAPPTGLWKMSALWDQIQPRWSEMKGFWKSLRLFWDSFVYLNNGSNIIKPWAKAHGFIIFEPLFKRDSSLTQLLVSETKQIWALDSPDSILETLPGLHSEIRDARSIEIHVSNMLQLQNCKASRSVRSLAWYRICPTYDCESHQTNKSSSWNILKRSHNTLSIPKLFKFVKRCPLPIPLLLVLCWSRGRHWQTNLWNGKVLCPLCQIVTSLPPNSST